MTLYYSAAVGGFFSDAIHPQLPADARPVADEVHAALMDAQGQGLAIVGDANGDPVAVEPPPPPLEQRIASMRATRDRLLRESDHTQLPDNPLSPEQRALWGAYRQALRDLPESNIDLDAIIWPLAPEL